MQQVAQEDIVVEADFIADYRAGQVWPIAVLHGATVHPTTPDGWFDLERDLYWLDMRRVSCRKRKIRVAKGFECPADVRIGLRAFRRKLLDGEDLNPHLGRGILKLTAQDGLFTHWGIYHFHLGIEPDPNHPTLIKGTKELLFAWVTDEAVYHIAVKDHDAWTDRELLRILHDNWPELLDRFLMRGISIGAPAEYSTNELNAARKCLMMPVEIDGRAYMPLGGGVTTAGTSVRATMCASRWRAQIVAFEEWAKANAPTILRENGCDVQSPLRLHLQRRDSHLFAVSTEHRFGIPMG